MNIPFMVRKKPGDLDARTVARFLPAADSLAAYVYFFIESAGIYLYCWFVSFIGCDLHTPCARHVDADEDDVLFNLIWRGEIPLAAVDCITNCYSFTFLSCLLTEGKCQPHACYWWRSRPIPLPYFFPPPPLSASASDSLSFDMQHHNPHYTVPVPDRRAFFFLLPMKPPSCAPLDFTHSHTRVYICIYIYQFLDVRKEKFV